MENRRPITLFFATSGHSGVDRIVANLVAEFADLPLHFDLVTIRGHGPYLDTLPANVRPVPLAAAHRNTVLPSLVRYLRRERPRALFTASHRLNRAALLARALARVDPPVAIRMGMTLSGQAESLKPRRARALFRSMRFWYPRADAVIAPSPGVGEDLITLAGVARERLHVIPNPVVTPALFEQAAAPLDHPWFPEPDGAGGGANGAPPVILAAGSLEPRKDFATLIRAFARLRAERPARLVILGEGRERPRLEALAAELGIVADVDLPGFESNPYRYMARAAVFALTSLREGSGAVLVEALACGTPCVATDCPTGPATILRDGAVGPLVAVGDDAGLARALAELLDRPPSPAVLRAATEPFSAATSAHAYLDALGLALTASTEPG
ncbi:MAG: glycosyltransferase [Thiohalospira sp.]